MLITGVIGYPLKQTYSPLLHNTAFKALKINGVYYPMRVQPTDFGTIISSLKTLGFTGVNITNPYKKKVIKYLDAIDARAKSIGAVNTILIEKERIIGFNTDFYGFAKSLSEHNIRIKSRNILLIGAGGVSSACAYVLKGLQPRQVFITNRTIYKAKMVARLCAADVIGFEQIKKIIRLVDIVINATSVDLQNMIIPALKENCIYYDTNYWFKLLKRRGIFVVNGLSMLIYQAALSFSIWTRHKPPVAIMKAALKGGAGC
ncbi:MAG: shikimate dehydrogenase [bacterium]